MYVRQGVLNFVKINFEAGMHFTKTFVAEGVRYARKIH